LAASPSCCDNGLPAPEQGTSATAQPHRAGFVSIIGMPNVGKSTLMNKLVGERLSIMTPKAGTTRHRILGILNGDDYQLIYSDTPGIYSTPQYKLHEGMMAAVKGSLNDADVVLLLVDVFQVCAPAARLRRRNKISVPGMPWG
jgi:GTP-binding protein Era